MVSKNLLSNYLKKYKRKIILNEDRRFVPSAVLVPIILHNDNLFLVLTKRTSEVEHHKGQISFPGGRLDENDSSLVHAALRECREEIGLNPSMVDIIGMLDDLSVPSGYLISPIVAFVKKQNWTLNKSEVESVLELPLSDFINLNNFRIEKRGREGKIVDVYFYDVHTEPVWGATAYIIHNLCRIISAE